MRTLALLPGALLVGVGVGLLQILTFTYVVHVVTRKSALYGAIGIALALLLWTYFAGRLLTAAIAANASLWRHRTGHEPGPGDRHSSPPPEDQARTTERAKSDQAVTHSRQTGGG